MKKIYLVDDDSDIIESLTLILETQGYTISSQSDEIDIVDNIKNFAPDLVILDVMFPEDDEAGFKIARKLRADDDVKNIPVIMLSGVNEEGVFPGKFTNRDIDDSFLPISEFVEKPINPDLLLEKIHKFI